MCKWCHMYPKLLLRAAIFMPRFGWNHHTYSLETDRIVITAHGCKAAPSNSVQLCIFNRPIVCGKLALKSSVIHFARPEEIVFARLEANCCPTSRFLKKTNKLAWLELVQSYRKRMNISSRTAQDSLEVSTRTLVLSSQNFHGANWTYRDVGRIQC